ncbi:MAG: hypothetical protein RIT24_845 [Planctomycetota bacterium]
MGGRSEDLRVRKLSERALKERGTLPVSMLLEMLVPLARLREVAAEVEASPKGFRIEKAPVNALAAALAELKEPESLDKALALLLELRPEKRAVTEPKADAARDAEHSNAVAQARFHEQECKRMQGELERSRESLQRAADRESDLRRKLERGTEDLQKLRAENARLREVGVAQRPPASTAERDLANRLHDLELELEARVEADEAVRRQLASDRTRLRELEAEVEELTALLPKGRKRKAPPPPNEPEHRLQVPWFLPSFYKSLDGKDRRSVERAIQAVLLFCTEGHAYPGLEVKQLGGQDTWSMRASLGLRVYFRPRADGGIDVLELADREDQHTTLRRLKER